MKFLKGNQSSITVHSKEDQPIVYDAEIVELEPIESDFFRCPTAADIIQAEQQLEKTRKFSYWQWLKNVLG